MTKLVVDSKAWTTLIIGGCDLQKKIGTLGLALQ